MAKAKEFYQQASKDWLEGRVSQEEKEVYKRRAKLNKNHIEDWYRMHQNSSLLDQIESIEQDLSELKKIIRKIERDLGIR